jgi:hypothetical protein
VSSINVVVRQVRGPTGPTDITSLALADGSAFAPSLTWEGEPTSGLYRVGPAEMRLSVLGLDTLGLAADRVRAHKRLTLPGGSEDEPALAPQDDDNTGVWFPDVGVMHLRAGDRDVLRLSSMEVVADRPVRGVSGTPATPALASADDIDTGVFWEGPNRLGLSAGGTAGVVVHQSYTRVNTQVRAVNGSVGAPAYSFASDPDTGFFRPTTDTVAIVGGGVERLRVSAQGIAFNSGTAVAPSIYVLSDTDTGIYSPDADQVALATGGVERVRVTNAGMQVTGTITGTAVTQSPTDATAGRLLKVGDFGLGLVSNAPPTVADLDDATLPVGFYRVTPAGTTAGTWPPSMSATGGYLTVRRYNVDNVEQTLARQGVTTHGIWRRLYTSGTWQAWQLVGLQVLGTVSQTAGTPTGALWQGNAHEASPANGYFERSANGFQTCQHTITSSASSDTTWTFPAAFLSGSTPQISITPVGDSDLRPRVVSRSATSVVFSIRDGSGARVAVPVDLIARGRWSAMA